MINTLLPQGARGSSNSTCVAPPAVPMPYLFDPYADRHDANISSGSLTTKRVVPAAYVPVVWVAMSPA